MSVVRNCEICKKPIDPERADAIPDTRLCTEHARQIERFGGECLRGGDELTSVASGLAAYAADRA